MEREKYILKGIKAALLIILALIANNMKATGQSIGAPTEVLSAKDSLSSVHLSSIQGKKKPKSDTLILLSQPRKKLDSLGRFFLTRAKKAQGNADTVKLDIDKKLLETTSSANKKIDSLKQKVHSKLSINPTQKQNSAIGSKLEKISNPLEKAYTVTPEVDAAKEKIIDLNLDKAEKLQRLPSEKLEELESLKEVKAVTDNADYLTKGKAYTEDLAALREGNLDKIDVDVALAQKVQSLEGVVDLEAKKAEIAPQLEGYKNMSDPLEELGGLEPLNDGDALQQQATNHIKVLAKDYLAQHGDKLKAAQNKLSKLKKKFGGLESINDIPTRTGRGGNPLKGKAFGERLIIGGNFQIYKGKPFGLDISPQLAYKLTPKFRLGVGGVYRTSFGNDDITISQGQPTLPTQSFERERAAYGFSAYLAHDVYKNFYAHGEFEKLNTRRAKELDEVLKPLGNWHESAYLGIGKTYKISQKVKGNILILYDVLNDKTNPYRKPWNIRFGFQLSSKKPSHAMALEDEKTK